MATKKSAIQEESRVRCVDDRGTVGTVKALHKTTADVLFDGQADPQRVPMGKIELKRGRTFGTVRVAPKQPPPVEFECILTDVVRARMAKLRLSWLTLTEASGLSRATIARVLREGGERQPISTIEALARALGVMPGEFWRRVPKAS